jgi:hypothetical protein
MEAICNRRGSTHLLLFLVLICSGCGVDDHWWAPQEQEQSRELHSLPFPGQPPFPSYQWDSYLYQYPDVNPRMGETSSAMVLWEAQGAHELRLTRRLYDFDSPTRAQVKFVALQRHFFYSTSHIFPKLFSRPLNVYKPQAFNYESAVAIQEDFGCIDHDDGEISSFTRCDYLAQHGQLISVVSIVFVESDQQEVLLEQFSNFVAEVDAALHSQQVALPPE